ncbi:MAG TPA: hypothetical protein VD865_14930 [Stenotrophomonas sp.]|nr:hypothetical protein [Stenotrophomonas sp.]
MLTALLTALAITAGAPVEQTPAACAYDQATMLALDQQQFDQDVSGGGGGWRAVAARPGCERAAADLIRDYRAAHPGSPRLLFWHEGQLRAFTGDYAAATALMQASMMPAEEDRGGWNPYVEATLAFLRHDAAALAKARKTLAAVPAPPDLPPVKDGHVELPLPDGQLVKMRWPPNVDVVDGLARCIDKPYVEAYGAACRERGD